MKTRILRCLLAIAFAATAASAQQMNYQGRLTDNAGAPRPGPQATLTFSMWTLPTGGTNVWGDFALNADLIDGRFSVKLGTATGADSTGRLLSNAFGTNPGPRYLQIKVGSDEPLPRQEVLPAPTALHAVIANTVPDGAIGNEQLANNSVSGDKIQDNTISVSKLTGAGASFWDGNGTSVWRSNGNVGIGTTTPGNKLSVSGNADFTGNATFTGRLGIGTTSPNAKLHANVTTVEAIPGLRVQVDGTTKLTVGSNGGTSIGANNNTPPVNGLFVAGNVGIGSFSPGARLHIGGSYPFFGTPPLALQTSTPKATATTSGVFALSTSDAANPFGMTVRISGDPVNANRAVIFQTGEIDANDAGNLAFQYQGGNVGIGTANPTRARLEVNGTVSTNVNIGGYLTRDGAGDASNSNRTSDLAIYASGEIAGTIFLAFSDARIKDVQGRSDGALDLTTLGAIEITDYTFKDVIGKGNKPMKKVIAQQIETVFPQAVSTITDIVPDIYKKAALKDGWVLLATDLKKGERVRLIGDKSEGIHEVLEVDAGRFRTDFEGSGDEVFVYGREVNDFRTVDYEAIAMLNVSATQELARKLAEKDAEIAALKKQLADQKAKDTDQDEQLAKLTRLLKAESGPGAVTAVSTGGLR